MSVSIDVEAEPSISGSLPLRASIVGTKIVLTADASVGGTLAISETEGGRAVKVCLSSAGAPPAPETPSNVTPAARTSTSPVAPPASSPRPSQPTTTSSGTAKTNTNPTITQAVLELAPPSSPAFSVLGLTPQTVDHPGTPGQLATDFTNGFDQRGNFQTGLALDFAPYMIFAGNGLTIARYTQGTVNLRRWAARTQVSFATTKGASNSDTSVRMAAGLRTSIFDLGDPRLDTELSKCFASIGDFGPTLTLTSELEKTLTERIETAAAKCRAASAKRNWNRSSWVIAGAPAWISADGLSGNFRFDGAGVWTSLAYGFEGSAGLKDHAQLVLHARYRNGEYVPSSAPAGSTPVTFLRQNSTALGGMLRFGLPSFNGDFEGLFTRTDLQQKRNDGYRVSFGVERQLTQDLWLNLSWARNSSDPLSTSSRNSVLGALKWTFNSKPTMQLAPP